MEDADIVTDLCGKSILNMTNFWSVCENFLSKDADRNITHLTRAISV